MEEINYKQKYSELYKKVANLLVENKKRKEPYSPEMLLNLWDNIRGKE